MRGNFGLFRTFSPKLPRIHVDFIVMQMRKINREKGYWNKRIWEEISIQDLVRSIYYNCRPTGFSE